MKRRSFHLKRKQAVTLCRTERCCFLSRANGSRWTDCNVYRRDRDMPHHTERLSVSQRSAADLRAQLSTLVYHKNRDGGSTLWGGAAQLSKSYLIWKMPIWPKVTFTPWCLTQTESCTLCYNVCIVPIYCVKIWLNVIVFIYSFIWRTAVRSTWLFLNVLYI